MELIFPLLIVFMIGMIFVSNRQRRKQQQQQEQLQNALAVGDIVVMTSGISGTVVDTDDEKSIDLEIAPDVVTTWLRAAVREKIGGDVEVVDGVDGVDAGPDALEATPAEAPGTAVPATDTSAGAATTGTSTGSTASGSTASGSTASGSTASGSTAAPANGTASDGVTAGSTTSGEQRSS